MASLAPMNLLILIFKKKIWNLKFQKVTTR